MKETNLILSKVILVVFLGMAYPLIALSQPVIIDPNGDIQCEILAGAAYGLCTAAYAVGCDKTDHPGCDKLANNFRKITGEEPPWLEEGCFDNLDCGGDGFFDPFCETPQKMCESAGICQTRPDTCINIYDPVCGCDNVTYTNECIARASGVSINYDGVCD